MKKSRTIINSHWRTKKFRVFVVLRSAEGILTDLKYIIVSFSWWYFIRYKQV